jgi:hypothetical protein
MLTGLRFLTLQGTSCPIAVGIKDERMIHGPDGLAQFGDGDNIEINHESHHGDYQPVPDK